MSKKKEKYIEKVGITGDGVDYNVYHLTLKERAIGYLIGLIAGGAAMQIMFGSLIASLILGAVIGFFSVPIYRKVLLEKRRKEILMQFRDLLDSLSNSFSAGKNTPDAFNDSFNDMKLSYGREAPITKEISIIMGGLQSNFTIEDLLMDMSARCGSEDIYCFADTFSACNRIGGNLKKIVSESRDIINDKIEIKMEIDTTIAASKNEMNIMAAMPFLIVMMMGTMGEASITENTPINVVVKVIALGMFAIAYVIGRKMTAIKV